MGAEPFQIAIPDSMLSDLRERLRRARWAPDFGNDDWRYGTNEAVLRELVDRWVDGFDWRAQEATMNEWPQWRVELDGIPIHFFHVRGEGPAPLPLVLSHGWPWTYWDYRDVIGPLTNPGAHGGDPADAFDVVVPSLSILAEPPVTVVDKVVDKKGTRAVAQAYLEYLYSPEGQEIAAKNYYRPRLEAVANKYAATFPKVNLVTIDDVFGGWQKAQKTHFADGGVFDQIYQPR